MTAHLGKQTVRSIGCVAGNGRFETVNWL